MRSHFLRHALYFGAIFTILFCCRISSSAQITDVRLTGRTGYYQTGNFVPLPDITVKLLDQNFNVLATTISQANGTFEFQLPALTECPPKLAYSLEISSPIWSPNTNGGSIIGCRPPGVYSFFDVILVRVTSVSFEEAYADQLSTNANAGGGLRMYPDKHTPSDTDNRRIVNIGLAVTQTQAVQRVFYKIFDLDDPSANTAPVDANGSLGNDNRGTNSSPAVNLLRFVDINGGQTAPSSAVTFTVTMQPGDNFAIAASCNADYLNGVVVDGTALKDAAGNTITTSDTAPKTAHRSEMLTIWRKLHIEVDSMGTVQNNYAEGTIPDETMIRRLETKTINLNPNSTLEPNRFEDGRLVVNGNSFAVTCSVINGINCNTGNAVRVQNTGMSAITIPANSSFTLYDDDDFNNNDGNFPDGDTDEDISMPDTSLMTGSDNPNTNVFAPAYITPVYDIGDNNTNVTFVGNVPGDGGQEIRNLFDFDQIATENSTNFWTAYLLGGYQDIISEDEDPETEDATLGATDQLNGQGTVIHLETHGAKDCDEQTISCNVAATTAHEFGHLFNAVHEDGGIMNEETLSFTAASIAKIRTVTNQ